MNGSLEADLGLTPEVWLFLTVLTCLCLFFKFTRFWSIRNLDLILLFAQTPGLLLLTGTSAEEPWWVFAALFLGLGVWVVRCLVDLGLSRRPLLEPNLNNGGLLCFLIGLLLLVLVETIILPDYRGAARNAGDPHAQPAAPATEPRLRSNADRGLKSVIESAPPPAELRRLAAALGHLGITLGLLLIGVRHFERPSIGLGMSLSYLLLPYCRIALIDSGQLVAGALVVMSLALYRKPPIAGLLLGIAAAWMPAAIGLIPLWAGFYWGRGLRRFLLVAVGVTLGAYLVARGFPQIEELALASGARSLNEAGLIPTIEAPRAGSFWTQVDPAYRLPVVVLYVAIVVVSFFWPGEKNLGHLIAQSALLLIASEFWYLDEGGTHAAFYLPLILLMVFRPNLSLKRPLPLR